MCARKHFNKRPSDISLERIDFEHINLDPINLEHNDLGHNYRHNQRLLLLDNVQETWPLRLLHVKTMESIPRSEDERGVHYGGVRAPAYNIMSYTWGRYRDDAKGEAIAVTGPGGSNLGWDIPKIKRETAFGANDFSAVLREVAGDGEFVWVDVACMNQNQGSPDFADQLGKQAAIFNRARQSYVWLHQTGEEEMKATLQLMTEILESAFEIREGVNSHGKYKNNIPQRHADIKTLERLLVDPWFSSLWTLQEAYIQKDAVILAKGGRTVHFRVSSVPELLTVRSISGICTQLHSWVWQPIKTLIDEAGLRQLQSKNPLVLLSASARRTATQPADKIYGIMQIFGLRLASGWTCLAS
ncbi:hypothetical protein G7Z17_g9764 [Cylindrodendrum hubeiense]|uniref:Heterokaryon incompatibility domain-containing protein n=1 Tax=Cylindrodendrum hubeiense TaxID=595255 RepID=A0A9P5H3D1_9HYPO|nr:hypothetical protein G7Z17_g9764 [Cylindrodendrum hubeiense]